MLIVPILVFWAIPALILLTRDRRSLVVVGIIFAVALAFLTVPLLLSTLMPKHSTSCDGGSCDGDMVVAMFMPFVWMAIVGGWASLVVFALLKASTIRATERADVRRRAEEQRPDTTP